MFMKPGYQHLSRIETVRYIKNGRGDGNADDPWVCPGKFNPPCLARLHVNTRSFADTIASQTRARQHETEG